MCVSAVMIHAIIAVTHSTTAMIQNATAMMHTVIVKMHNIISCLTMLMCIFTNVFRVIMQCGCVCVFPLFGKDSSFNCFQLGRQYCESLIHLLVLACTTR